MDNIRDSDDIELKAYIRKCNVQLMPQCDDGKRFRCTTHYHHNKKGSIKLAAIKETYDDEYASDADQCTQTWIEYKIATLDHTHAFIRSGRPQQH